MSATRPGSPRSKATSSTKKGSPAPAKRKPGDETVAEARAAVEARRSEVRAEREARFATAFADGVPGRATIVVSWISTAVLAVVTTLAVADPDAFITAFFVVAVVWFFAGSALFAIDIVVAAARSRDDAMGIGGLFFLAGSAPSSVRKHLLGSLATTVVISVTGAAIRPFTPLAFGVLAPVLALSLGGWWSVRHGLFDPQPPAVDRRGRR